MRVLTSIFMMSLLFWSSLSHASERASLRLEGHVMPSARIEKFDFKRFRRGDRNTWEFIFSARSNVYGQIRIEAKQGKFTIYRSKWNRRKKRQKFSFNRKIKKPLVVSIVAN
jgi:hypothetical protein